MISSDQPSVDNASSIIPLVNEEPQLNPPAISQDAAGQQVIQSTDERWDTMGEDLVQRELISTQVTPEMVAFMGELDSKCHQEVKKFINIRVEFGLEYPKFYPESLDEARGDPTVPVHQFLTTSILILGHYGCYLCKSRQVIYLLLSHSIVCIMLPRKTISSLFAVYK